MLFNILVFMHLGMNFKNNFIYMFLDLVKKKIEEIKKALFHIF
jgi:hypothetical protein